MAILNYSGLLQGGALGAGKQAAGLAGLLQGQQVQRQQMQNMQEDRQMQQQAAQQDTQARELGAQLLHEGTPEQIAEFGIKNPAVMKDFIAAANFQDQQAQSGRLNYARDILSGNVNPKAALQSRIAEVEARGGDAQGLRKTLELGTDEAIVDAARKDFAVLDPQGYKTYQQATTAGQPKAATEYERALIESKKVDQDLRQQEIELKKAETAAKKETDALRKEKLMQEVTAKQQTLEASKQKKAQDLTSSIAASSELVSSIDDILNNPQYIEDLSGISGKLPTVMPSGTDADVAFDNLVNQLTLDNLGLMSGVLTDRDIAVLRSAAAGLEKGMSKGKFVSQLRKIKARTQSKIKVAEKDLKNTGAKIPDDSQIPKIRSEADILSQYGIEL